ncbi:MAG: phage antirepressor N-terminal domain-containing protein [Chloroflexota bacterium]
MSDNALIPTSQRTVFFYDDEITAVVFDGETQEIYVPLRPLCDYLGLNWSGQRQRIHRDPVLSQVKGECVIHSPSSGERGGGSQTILCLPLDYLNGWLFGISANRVNDDVRDKLVRYQLECYRVLAREFVQTAVSATPSATSALQSVYEMGMAIAHLAKEQMQFEQCLDKTDDAVLETALAVVGLQQRVQELEGAIASDEAVVTSDEAMQISQAVKTVAIAEGKRTGRNEFGATYGELYRKFGVTSYKQVPRSKFMHVMKWLNEWFVSISDDDWPF